MTGTKNDPRATALVNNNYISPIFGGTTTHQPSIWIVEGERHNFPPLLRDEIYKCQFFKKGTAFGRRNLVLRYFVQKPDGRRVENTRVIGLVRDLPSKSAAGTK